MHKDSEKLSKKIFNDNLDHGAYGNACPDCGGHVTENCDELYCTKCGLVLDDRPINFGIDCDDEKDDWVWSKGKSRVGNPARYSEGNVSHTEPTQIG